MSGTGEAGSPPLVLHVIPTAVARGAQREARALATVLDVPGARHHRLLSLFAGPSGVPVDVDLAHPARGQAGVGFDVRLARRLRAELRRLDPAVLVAHGGDPLKYLVAATLGARRPLAYYATGTFEHAARPARVRAWRALVRRADVVACEGSEVLDEVRRLLRVPPARSLLAPNGRDPAEFHPPDGPHPEPPTVAFVGAFTTGKRPDRFVAVVDALRRRGMPVRAVACGDGPLKASLEERAAAAGVRLLGSRADVAEVLRGADLFVFPSRPTGEGMPGVLIEAGLTGLAVVASAVPGVSSVVEDGVTGFVVDAEDAEAMVDATARLVADPGLRRRMGAAARQRCAAQFSLDAVAACWTAFLSPLVAGAVSARAGRSGPGNPRAPGA
ncbi:MAG TPA: glycosyltransferase family 4 protein [Acidimicrobiales bacterium]|nr:glycosyltransferase family 4 protein [Acidimicrobiales bacterium]